MGHSKYQTLSEKFKRINSLDHATTMLSWDQMVMMPKNGVVARSETLAELSVMRHELLSSTEMNDTLAECENDSDSLNAAEIRSVKAMRVVFDEASCIPASLLKNQVIVGAQCEHAWRTQRPNNDWKGFLVNFKEVVTLSIEEAKIRQEATQASSPYDALLALHCKGDSSALIDGVFAALKAELPEMIDAAMEKQAMNKSTQALSPSDRNPLGHAPSSSDEKISNDRKSSGDAKISYPENEQTALSEALMASLGFDFDAGRLDVSAHPFSSGVRGDQRITTRYDNHSFLDALLATAHETGHASYEAGLPDEWVGLPVGHSRNMCIHESQSLLFEKMVTLSASFLQHLHALVTSHLSQANTLSYSSLLAQARAVSKSYIRVEADELTYPIHVALRYDIERDLMNENMAPEDIPQAWDEAMTGGLGLSTKNNYSNGCMQDIHWTDGAFGYFPSYTMGAVNSAQLFQAFSATHTDWEEQFAEGDIDSVRTWLSDNIWQHGSHLTSQELMINATGKGSDAQSLLTHLRARYLEQ